MPVQAERHEVAMADQPLTFENLVLKRAASGAWSLSGRVHVAIDLGDGRMIWGYRPIKITGLGQQGRKGTL